MPRRERTERVHGPYKHGRKWRVVVTQPDRSQTTKSFESKYKAEAVANAARAQAAGRTMMHAVDAFEVWQRERGLAGVSIDRGRRHLNVLLQLETYGSRLLTWVTAARAAELYAQVQKGRAVDTHRNALKVGRGFFKYCVKNKWLLSNPFAGVEGEGIRKRGKPQLHVDEACKLVDFCLDVERSRESIAVATAFMLGFGASEVANRKVRDLDNRGTELRMTKGKNKFRERAVELPPKLAAALAELVRDRAGAAYLFGEGDIDRPSRYWMHYHCKRLCKAAGVPIVTPHGLRGSHATIAMERVSTAHSVQAALAAAGASLGHAASSPITATTYVRPGAVARAKQRAVMRVLDGGAGNRKTGSDYQP